MKVSILTTALLISLVAPIASSASSKTIKFAKGEQLIVNIHNKLSGKDSAVRAEFLSLDEYNSEVTVKILDPIPYVTAPVMELPMSDIFRSKGCVNYEANFKPEKICVGDRVTQYGETVKVAGTSLDSQTIVISQPATQNSTETLEAGLTPEFFGLMEGCYAGFCVGDKIGLRYSNYLEIPGVTYAKVTSVGQQGVFYTSARGVGQIRSGRISALKFVEYASGFPEDSLERDYLDSDIKRIVTNNEIE